MKKAVKRITALILAVVIAASAAISVFAENGAVKKHTYDIAVVFDNSTSMYGNDEWCQAKYSMEIFASMLDYSRDRLTIFPMWEVQTAENPVEPNVNDTANFNPQEAANPVEIKNISDIDKIHRMYTTYGGSTPFSAAENAKDYLASSDATDKWLIVLTDGVFDNDSGVSDPNDLADRLISFAKSGINVQYLGIGVFANDLSSKSDPSRGFYADKAIAASLLSDMLINICNRIFQRNILPVDKLEDKSVTFDISMNKVIVFVQGDGAKIKGLSDSSNKAVGKISDSGERKYSDKTYSIGLGYLDGGAVTKDTVTTNDELYGHVVIFDRCTAGTYSLDYDGDRRYVQIFYEPDVDIKYSLSKVGSDEIFIDDSMLSSGAIDIDEGEYRLDYYLADGVTGDRIEDSALLGRTDISGTIEYADGKTIDIASGETVTLEPGDGVKFKIGGTYLDGQYRISTEDSKGIINLNIKHRASHKLETKVECEQAQNWYCIKDSDSWQPVLITAKLDGEQLTGEELARAELKLSSESGIKYTTPQLIEDGSAFIVYVFRDDNGEVVIPEAGVLELFNGKTCDLKAELTYQPEDSDEPLTDDSGVKVRVSNTSLIMHNLFALVILGVILFLAGMLFIFLKNKKCFPKRVVLRTTTRGFHSKTLCLTDNGRVAISLGANPPIAARCRKKTNFFVRKNRSASFEIYDIMPQPRVRSMSICGQSFIRNGNQFVMASDKKTPIKDFSTPIVDGSPITYTVSSSNGPNVTVNGTFEINH